MGLPSSYDNITISHWQAQPSLIDILVWHLTGFPLVPTWVWFGSYMGYLGSFVGFVWFLSCSGLEPFWVWFDPTLVLYCFYLGFTWFQHGFGLILPGFDLVYTWVLYGSYRGLVWFLPGFCMVSTWVCNGFLISFAWFLPSFVLFPIHWFDLVPTLVWFGTYLNCFILWTNKTEKMRNNSRLMHGNTVPGILNNIFTQFHALHWLNPRLSLRSNLYLDFILVYLFRNTYEVKYWTYLG